VPGLVLIIDPDDQFAKSLGAKLRAGGFQVRSAPDVRRGLAAALLRPSPDVVILEAMQRDGSGVELCRRLKQDAHGLAVIICSTKGEEIDRIVGFEVGADDYVVKPPSLRELVLRVQALTRRMHVKTIANVDTYGVLRIDDRSRRVWVGKDEIALTALEFRLLRLLVTRRGRPQSRRTLLHEVWDIEAPVETRTVDTHVKRLREKLGAAGDYIATIRGIGYCFELPT
jgi:two-component system phosphate regulon response regulator PhoB